MQIDLHLLAKVAVLAAFVGSISCSDSKDDKNKQKNQPADPLVEEKLEDFADSIDATKRNKKRKKGAGFGKASGDEAEAGDAGSDTEEMDLPDEALDSDGVGISTGTDGGMSKAGDASTTASSGAMSTSTVTTTEVATSASTSTSTVANDPELKKLACESGMNARQLQRLVNRQDPPPNLTPAQFAKIKVALQDVTREQLEAYLATCP